MIQSKKIRSRKSLGSVIEVLKFWMSIADLKERSLRQKTPKEL